MPVSQDVRPPVARRVPHTVYFGVNPEAANENRGTNPMNPPVTMTDELYWIRDNERKNPEVLSLLNAENAYTDSKTMHLEASREALYS